MPGASDEYGAFPKGLHHQDSPGQRPEDLSPFSHALKRPSPAQRSMEIDATKPQQVSLPPPPYTPPRPKSRDRFVGRVVRSCAVLSFLETGSMVLDAEYARLKNPDFDCDDSTGLLCNAFGLSPELFSDSKQSICSGVHTPKSKIFTQTFSLYSRSWRRLSDRLLPLLRREQDFEALQQWVEITRSSSSLFHLLDENESLLEDADTILLELLAQVEAVLNRFKLRFRRRYDELRQKYGLTQAIFEFPNNFRHICTTMPWTIAPALLVLWGVCWMFYASLSPEYERTAAVEYLPLPSPAVYDFLDDLSSTDTSDCFQYLNIPYPDGDGSQHIVQGSVHNDPDIASGFVDPLNTIPDTPRDLDFLTDGTSLHTSNFNLEMLGQDSDVTNWLPEAEATASDIQPQSHQVPDRQLATNVSGEVSESQCTSRQKELRFVCQDCKQLFATSFTLNRHHAEAHTETVSTVENSFPCPSPHCKRSKERSPFKRPYNLKRHLENCKYGKEIARPQVGPTSPLIVPTVTSPSTDKLPESEVSPEAVVRSNVTKKRTRSEEKEDILGEKCLMDDVVRRYKRMAEEVKKKKWTTCAKSGNIYNLWMI